MLIITRSSQQKILLTYGENPEDKIELLMVSVSGRKVQIGITAPPSVHISRPDARNQEPRKLA